MTAGGADVNNRDEEQLVRHEQLEAHAADLSVVSHRLGQILGVLPEIAANAAINLQLESLNSWIEGRRRIITAELVRMRTPED